MPPGSAKSTYVSDLFAAWWFGRYPDSAVIAASHTAELAERFGRRVRNRIAENSATLGVGIRADSAAAGRWETTAGGEYYAAGVGGSITGRRADLLIIDDPVASRQDADSKLMRDRAWDWFRADAYTRLKPGARIVVVMTRWHEDDLGGRLLAEMAAGGDKWEVIRLPAIAEADDPLGRAVGEPLWPEWEPLKALEAKRRAVGTRDWSALYQQRPTPAEGSIIKSEWWKPWIDPVPGDKGAAPPDCVLVSLDPAYTAKDDNDPSACTVWHVVTDPRTVRTVALLRYAWAERLEFPALVTQLAETVEHFGIKHVPVRCLVEAKASGLSVIQEMHRRLPDLAIDAIKPRSDKVARAHAVTALFEGGNVYALATKGADGVATFRPWAEMVRSECAAFPQGQHDDLVDSVTQALGLIRASGFEFFAEDEPTSPPVLERPSLF